MQHAATLLGRSFSIVTTLARTIGQAEHLVERFGSSASATASTPATFPCWTWTTRPRIPARSWSTTAGARSEVDQADTVLLGCAGMAYFAAEFGNRWGFR